MHLQVGYGTLNAVPTTSGGKVFAILWLAISTFALGNFVSKAIGYTLSSKMERIRGRVRAILPGFLREKGSFNKKSQFLNVRQRKNLR
jgi:hypothetical protein